MDALREQLQASLAGRYVIERELGRGGMATVFLARDLKHDRLVALKLLNAELGAVVGAERFLSEIRVTANLQHPNLLPLFDSGSADGLLYYVMPYVEGETLRHRLDRERQLPIEDAVRLTIAIAGALDYAHQRGVIHRDLKPENVLLQHGQPVVADFGIALAVSNAGGERVTQTGLSLGTPQYMSPEQATGDRIIDARTDIYSLGAMTYEMLAGEPPHVGTTAQAVIARMMTEEPRALSVARPSVPPHMDDAVRCALEKLPADRFGTAGEFAAALRGDATLVRTRHARATAASSGRHRQRLMIGALAFASAVAITLAALLVRAISRPDAPRYQLVVDLPPGQHVAITEGSAVTMAPDGRSIAYVGAATGAGSQRVFIRPLDSLYPRPVPGSNGGNTPRFSADGRWLAFQSPSDLRRVPSTGGGAEIMTSRIVGLQNFAWGPKGEVVLARRGSLWRLDSRDSATRLTAPDTVRGELSHAAPLFLDDDETIAFWLQKSTADGAVRGIGITSLSGGKHTVLDIAGDVPLGYIAKHLLVSSQSGVILAYPFELGGRRVTGAPTSVLDSVVWIAAGGLQAFLGRDGSLVYVRGSAGRRLALLDAQGIAIAETPELRNYGAAAIAPDGKRVAVEIGRAIMGGRNLAGQDIWIWDVESRGMVRFTTEGGSAPTWSADGKRIAFIRTMTGGDYTGDARYLAWWGPIDQSVAAVPIIAPGLKQVTAVRLSPSGTIAILVNSAASEDIYSIDLTKPGAVPVPLARSRFRETEPLISPDGRWLAYRSDVTGRLELYLRPLEGDGAPVRVSTGSSGAAMWASNGKRLIYPVENGAMLAATLSTSGSSVSIVRQDTVSVGGGDEPRDLEPSTGRMLVAREPGDRRIVVVPHWSRDIEARLRRR